jgi:hypothetical protein
VALTTPSLRFGLLGLALAAGVPAALVASSASGAAQAQAPVIIEVTKQDEAGDADTENAAVDIESATVTQDRTNGIFTAKVTFAGDPLGMPAAWIHAGLGFSYGTDTCYIGGEAAGVAHLKAQMGGTEARWSVSANTDVSGPATQLVEGRTVTLTSQASPLLKSPFVCMGIGTFAAGENGKLSTTIYDDIVASLPLPPTPNPVAPPAVGEGKPQVALDRDGDATPDSTDQCPDVPGAGTNGCLTTPLARAFRLGTKRLVVDHLLRRTASTCPTAVKATVAAKGRTIGKQKLGVIAKGSWCHVTGIVKLKKRAKQVRVAIAGTGIAGVKQVVRR